MTPSAVIYSLFSDCESWKKAGNAVGVGVGRSTPLVSMIRKSAGRTARTSSSTSSDGEQWLCRRRSSG